MPVTTVKQVPTPTFAGAAFGLALVILGCLPFPVDFRATAAVGAALVAIFVSMHVAQRTVAGKASAREFGLLGFAVFGFGDAAKFLLGGQPGRTLSPETEKEVLAYIAISFVGFVVMTWSASRLQRREIPEGPEVAPHLRSLIPVVLVAGPVYWYMLGSGAGAYADIPGALLKACFIVLVFVGLRQRRKWVLAFSLVVGLVALPDSSRRAFVVTVAPLLLLLVDGYTAHIAWRRRAVYGAAAALFILLNALRANHDYGEGFVREDPIGNTLSYITSLRSLDTFFNSGFVIETMPRLFPFRLGDTYIAVLLAPIPRSLWPTKPVGFSAPLAMMQAAGVADFEPDLWMSLNQFSLSPGFVGEAYANFGMWGIMGATLLLGLLARLVDRASSQQRFRHRWTLRNLWVLPLLGSFTLVGRGDFYVSVNYSLPIAVFVALLSRLVRRGDPHANTHGLSRANSPTPATSIRSA